MKHYFDRPLNCLLVLALALVAVPLPAAEPERGLSFDGLAPASEAKAASLAGRFDITGQGAVGDGKTLNSRAIQAAIDKCAQAGGGTLVIPKGEFVSGALFLKPGVNLEL